MMLLVCLLNLIFYAIICLFVLWVLGLILGMFIPGFPTFGPNFGQPAAASPGRAISLVYLLIGIVLLINFLLCAFGGGGHELLPPLWNGGYGMR
jgi:hypothetical protein